ncbi:USP domain-containing protein [Favolaschia claudopus]|uniref:Probable quinone oxidoreductase n=1 Tax=Favolaschia claudopus TaxID=2862362 RepID=A0AAW0EGN3_9AGAR
MVFNSALFSRAISATLQRTHHRFLRLPSLNTTLRQMSTIPTERRAIGINQIGDFDVLEMVTVPLKVVHENIVVKAEYLGINFIDTYYRKGLYPLKEFPAVIGTEMSGTILALPTNPEVLEDPEYKKRGFAVGAKVVVGGGGAFGLHSDYVSSAWKGVHMLPAGVSTQIAAAALLQGMTALSFVEEAHKVQKGETILVHTVAGGLGLLFAQLIKARGATVIGTTSTKEKAELAKANGADHVILYKEEDTVQRVLELTNGVGVDAVFDGVGKDTFDSNFKMLKRKGTLVSVGNASGAVPPMAPIRLVEKNLKLLRPTVGNYAQTAEELYQYTTKLFALPPTLGKTRYTARTLLPFATYSSSSMDNDSKTPARSSTSRRPLPTPGSTSTTQPARPSTPAIADEPVASTSVVPPSPKAAATQSTAVSSAVASSSISTSNFYGTQPPALPSRPKGVGSSHTTVWQAEDNLPSYGSSISTPGYREPELVSEDEMPELMPADVGWDSGSGWAGATWDASSSFTHWGKTLVKIDGRDLQEEANWWDPNRDKDNRPGPGMLPPLLADSLHNPEHNLYSISFTAPEFPPQAPANITPSNSSSGLSTSAAPPDPPSFQDILASVPHPDAYYCPKDNGWIILQWGYADHPPPLARSFEMSSHHPLPRSIRRNPENCSDSTANETHHFHKYEKAVDGHKLDHALHFDNWDTIETVKHKRRVGTVLPGELDFEKIALEDEDKMDVDEPEGPLLDLYVCCQCTCYLLRSAVIPGVIPRPLWDEFVTEKTTSPAVGKTPERSVANAIETLLLAIENKLWKGESRMLRVSREGFKRKMGWSPVIEKVFQSMGFTSDTFEDETVLRPPSTDPNQPQGKQNSIRLLRAWTEIGSWVANYERMHPALLEHDNKGFKLWVNLENVREKYQLGIGAHPDQIPRNSELGRENRLALEKQYKEWRTLGMTPIMYSPEYLTFAYLAQCRCDPGQTIEYYTSMHELVLTLEGLGIASESLVLVQLLDSEQERGRFSIENLNGAANILGFGPDGPLKECVKRSWRDLEGGSRLQTDATKALKIIADSRGSHSLQKVWEHGKRGIMSPERAYDTLEVPKDVDEEMLITVFTMRIEETPLQLDRMREAMLVIAEVRDSERLRKFLEIGHDPGVIVPPTRLDLPRGLNQLGNTCYLNSLLQYFYTIKDLRAAVSPMDGRDFKTFEDDKYSDDDLKRHRVGGRLVTRREIIRSKKCASPCNAAIETNLRTLAVITLLASLFWELEYCEQPAVTPALELAKLALVTSKDEEDDEDKGGTDTSNDTDATLVEDGPTRPAVSSPSQMAMDVDSPRPDSSSAPTTIPSGGEPSSSKIISGDTTVTKKAPTLPPRKATEVSNSTMMFGKQHDVSECMDNCMFQIETALLKFDGMSGNDDDKTSIVKRLFYGKIRQRIASDDLASKSSVHEKEDLFSHLPVNVADDGIDIYDGLSGYFDDVVEFEGKKARMEVTLVETPPLLQIQLQRVQFNRDTLQPYKSQAYVKFGETIYMDRFMDNADPQRKARGKEIQAELTKCRERIRTLLLSKRGPYTMILRQAHRFLSAQERTADLDEELLNNLQSEQEHIAHEIEHLRLRIDELKVSLEDLWRDCTNAPYELTSVFIHRGASPSFGHYFFYSRHLPEEPDSWFKYNDSDVSVINKSEVLADTTGSTANPYLLVFARKDSDVVETVKRFDFTKI